MRVRRSPTGSRRLPRLRWRLDRHRTLYGILAAGRPLVFIGDRKGEISLLVEREGIGVAVQQGDAAGLADQLLRVAGDAGMGEGLGGGGGGPFCGRAGT